MAEIKLNLGGKSPTIDPATESGWREATEPEQANCWDVYADARTEGIDVADLDTIRFKLFGPEERRHFTMTTAEADRLGKMFVELDGKRYAARLSGDRTLWVEENGFSGA